MNSIELQYSFKKYILLLLAICIFNSMSYPWPQEIGLIELIIMILMFSIFFNGYLHLFFSVHYATIYILIFFILSTIGILNNSFSDYIRDVISYIYTGIPLAFFLYFRRHRFSLSKNLTFYDQKILWLMFGISFIGLIFSIRAIYPFAKKLGLSFSLIQQSQLMPHFDYIFLDPAILFGAVFLLAYGVGLLNRNPLSGVLLVLLSLITISAPFFATIRAPVFLYLIIFLILIFYRFKFKTFIFILPLLLLVSNKVYSIFTNLLQKQELTGSNGKLEEFRIIFEHMSSLPLGNFLFGSGFGGVYYSSVLDSIVRYSHNIFSYSLLKGGIILFTIVIIVFSIIIYSSIYYLIRSYSARDYFGFISILSFLTSFLVNSSLEPGYKTLDYGFLLIIYFYFVVFRGILTVDSNNILQASKDYK